LRDGLVDGLMVSVRALILVVVLLLATACHAHGYKVAGTGAVNDGLGRFRSVSVEVTVAEGVKVEPKDLLLYSDELELRLRKTKVIEEVKHGPAPAELALRVTVTKLEPWKGLINGSGVEAAANVELVDLGRQASIGHFIVDAGNGGGLLPEVDFASRDFSALRNTARAIAEQVKKHR
jgi:hypothetical protein